MTKSTIRNPRNSRTTQDEANLGKKLDDIADEVLSKRPTLALNGQREPPACAAAEVILKATEYDEKSEAADRLAAILEDGNVHAVELSGKIINILQLRLPGMEDEAEQQTGPFVPAEPAVAAMTEKVSPMPQEPMDKLGHEIVSAEPSKAPEITWMSIDEIVPREPFSSLFPISPEIVKALVANMKSSGYDPSQPVTIWDEEDVPVDGHTRLKSARAAGLKKVAVYRRSFSSEDEAVEYAIHVQRDRRNLTDADIFHLVSALDQRKERGGDRKSAAAKSKTSCKVIDRSAAGTAKLIGISTTRVENARAVIDSDDYPLLEKVAAGLVSLNRAAHIARNNKNGQEPGTEMAGVDRAATKAKKAIETLIVLLEAQGETMNDIPARLKSIGAEIENAYTAITERLKSEQSQSGKVAHLS